MPCTFTTNVVPYENEFGKSKGQNYLSFAPFFKQVDGMGTIHDLPCIDRRCLNICEVWNYLLIYEVLNEIQPENKNLVKSNWNRFLLYLKMQNEISRAPIIISIRRAFLFDM